MRSRCTMNPTFTSASQPAKKTDPFHFNLFTPLSHLFIGALLIDVAVKAILILHYYQCLENRFSIKQVKSIIQLCILFLLTSNSMAQNKMANAIVCNVQFYYNDCLFKHVLTFDSSDYIFYRSRNKFQKYQNYCLENASHPYLHRLAKQLDEDASQMGYKDLQLAEYLIAFVQHIPYKVDPSNGRFDYPRYGIETIVEGGGDCEDHAALLVSLLSTFGFHAILVGLPGHMAAALSCNNGIGNYFYKGNFYSYIETTSTGWRIGCIPSKYINTRPTLMDVKRVSVYKRN